MPTLAIFDPSIRDREGPEKPMPTGRLASKVAAASTLPDRPIGVRRCQ